MKNTFKIIGIMAIAAIIGFSFAACNDGGESSGIPGPDAKTIVITDLETTDSFGSIWIVTEGTPTDKMINGEGYVAGSQSGLAGITKSSDSITILLYVTGSSSYWTGNGTYDVYVLFFTPDDVRKFYKSDESVSFDSTTTTVSFSKFTEIPL